MKVWFGVLMLLMIGRVEAQEDFFFLEPDTTAVDSLALLLAETPLEVVLEELGDSLLIPSSGRVRILRDRYGVPHIFGETDLDVAFGFGYAQAEDHLIDMLLNYRQARGRRSEIEGRAYLEHDYKALLWRIYTVAGELYGDIPKSTRSLVEAFASGINHYIKIHQQVLPHWVEEVNAKEVIALARWLVFLFAEQSGAPELAQKGLRPTLVDLMASNHWVVDASRSATGSPLFVMDSHLPWSKPLQWYEAHLVSREGLNVSGATMFGLPVILMGHTDRIAWSMTVNAADVFDLYEERLDPANPKRYFYEKEKERMTSRRVKIRVRGEPGEGVYEVEKELLYTIHGPVYKTTENWAYAAHTSMEDLVDFIGQFYAMNRAQGLEPFKRAMARLELPTTNVMYGDVDGNIFYVFNARCPVRSEEFDWRVPVPGWAAETQWQGILTFSQLPQITNPKAGFLQNCNTAAHLVTVESGLDPDVFPLYLGRGGFNNRGHRLLNWLLTHRGITVEDMKAMARDDYLIAAEEWKGIILRAYNQTWHEIYDPEGQVGAAVDILRHWNNRASVDSKGTLLFSMWKVRFDRLMGQLPAAQRKDQTAQEKLALEALRTAVEFMMSTYGKLDVVWGDVHHIRRGEQTFPISGPPPGTTALHMTRAKAGSDGVFQVTRGSSFTMVVSLTEPVQAWSLLPYGNSEDPESHHFIDQAPLQSKNVFKPAWFGEEEILYHLEKVTTIPYTSEEADLVSQRVYWRVRKKRGDLPGEQGMESEQSEPTSEKMEQEP
ncbi:MAG: penicillin acylase family protein [bacterium]|nr:penicillin acylase family protein [bacterium]